MPNQPDLMGRCIIEPEPSFEAIELTDPIGYVYGVFIVLQSTQEHENIHTKGRSVG